MKKKLYAAVAAAALAVIPATAAVAQDATAEVVIVHGVPGFSADIAVNGDEAYTAVEFNTVVSTDLPAGDYDLEVRAAGDDDTAVLSGSASLEAGMSYSVVAALDADGNPTLLVFGNASEEGIQVTHAAAFPNVDITPTDVTGLADVPSGATGFAATGAGTFEGLGVAGAGADENAIDLPALTVQEGMALLVYAIGPNEGEELPTLATAEIAVGADMEMPSEVDSGTGGLLETGLPMWVAALMVLGAVGVAAPAVAAARRD